MVKKLTDKLSEISYRGAIVAHFSFGVCMRKTVFFGVALLLMAMASACSSITGGPQHDMVYDIQSIEPKSIKDGFTSSWKGQTILRVAELTLGIKL